MSHVLFIVKLAATFAAALAVGSARIGLYIQGHLPPATRLRMISIDGSFISQKFRLRSEFERGSQGSLFIEAGRLI